MPLTRVALCLAAVLVGAASPDRAPSRFTTPNYQLTVRIPAGMFHCAYPANWVGSDHGINLYLEKPAACAANAPEAAAAEAGRLPQIRFFYAYNVADLAPSGSDFHPPRTKAELHRQACDRYSADFPAPCGCSAARLRFALTIVLR
jgi:hypothetical protein